MSISKDIIETELRTKGGNKVRSQMADLSKDIRKLKNENERLKVSKAKLEAQGKKNTKAWRQIQDQIKQNNAELTKAKGKYKELNGQLDITEKSASELKQEARKLRRELNNTSKATEPKRWKQLNGQLEKTEKQYRKVRAGTKRTSRLMQGLKDVLPIAGIGALVAGVGRLIGTWARWQTQLEKTRHTIRQLTDATGTYLDELTAKASAISKTFDVDLKRTVESANALAKQMNISYSRALDLIQEGFASGADASGEFLDMLREYPTQLQQIGLDADQAVSLMTQQVKEGVFSDKGIDAIKEAGISLREMTKPTQDAIEAIGLTVDQVQRVIGDEGLIGGIRLVSERLNQLEDDSPAVGMALADIFRGAGEDAGIEYLKTLQDINVNLDEVKEDTDEYAKAQRRLVEANEEVSRSMNAIFGEGSWWTKLKSQFKEFIASTLQGFRRIPFLMSQIFNSKPASEFQEVILNTTTTIGYAGKSIKQLAEEVRQYGTETDKGREALTKLNSALVEAYGSEGLKIAQNFTEQQRKLAQQRIQQRREEADANEEASEKTEKSFKQLNSEMERAYQQRTLALKEQLAAQKISQEQFQEEMQTEELSYLTAKKGLYERFGKSTLELEQQIADARIKINERIRNKSDEAREKWLQRLQEDREKLTDQLQQDLQQTDQWMENWADQQNQNLLNKMTQHRQKINDMLNQSYLKSLWDLKRALNQKEITQEEYNKAMEERTKAEAESWAMSGAAAVENAETVEEAAVSVLNSIRAQIKGYLADALAGVLADALKSVPFPLNIAVATAAAGAASFLFDKLVPKVPAPDSGGGARKTPQHASGTLDVIGEEDGRLYRNVPYAEHKGVGIPAEGRTHLYNEKGPELVFDAATTSNIMTNFPELIDMAKAYQVPQRAEGNLPETGQNAGDMQKRIDMNTATNAELTKTIRNLQIQLEKGISISAEKASEDLREWDDFENDIGY